MKKGYILVEGQGEVAAAQNLIARLSTDIACRISWSNPRRWKNLHQWKPRRNIGGVCNGAEFIRNKPDAGALLILRDEDDACPKEVALGIAASLRSLALPFPTAYVLLHPEYEVLFLPCLENMTKPFVDGRAGLLPGTHWEGSSWEARRGVKGWLSSHFGPGRRYKPTVDQLHMTRKIDLSQLRAADMPCFGSLERALRFIDEFLATTGAVYPPMSRTGEQSSGAREA